jgi:hypothetical protein
MEEPRSSLNIVDKFLATTDELLDFTKPVNNQGVATDALARVLKKLYPKLWYVEEDDDDECE